jgi:type IV pilus assembly protein PilO
VAYGEFEDDQAPEGIVLFGMTLSPSVLAVLLAAAGLGLSVWLGIKYVQPSYEKSEALKKEIAEKEEQLKQQGEIQKQIDAAQVKLDEAKTVQNNVLGMFSDPENLTTLALDLDRELNNRNAQLTPESIQNQIASCPPYVKSNYAKIDEDVEGFFARAKLTKFEPKALDASQVSSGTTTGSSTADGYEMVSDGSLGTDANSQVKRQVYDVGLEGNFDRILLTLRRLEQLQPLLLISDFKAEVPSRPVLVDARGPLENCQPETRIEASFKLTAVLPLSPEELAQMAAPAETEATPEGEKATK